MDDDPTNGFCQDDYNYHHSWLCAGFHPHWEYVVEFWVIVAVAVWLVYKPISRIPWPRALVAALLPFMGRRSSAGKKSGPAEAHIAWLHLSWRVMISAVAIVAVYILSVPLADQLLHTSGRPLAYRDFAGFNLAIALSWLFTWLFSRTAVFVWLFITMLAIRDAERRAPSTGGDNSRLDDAIAKWRAAPRRLFGTPMLAWLLLFAVIWAMYGFVMLVVCFGALAIAYLVVRWWSHPLISTESAPQSTT